MTHLIWLNAYKNSRVGSMPLLEEPRRAIVLNATHIVAMEEVEGTPENEQTYTTITMVTGAIYHVINPFDEICAEIDEDAFQEDSDG